MVKVYLAGPIRKSNDNGIGWRDRIKEEIQDWPNLDVICPSDKFNAPEEGLEIVEDPQRDGEIGVSEIVESDKADIQEADALFVGYEEVPSVGTPMEIYMAYSQDKPIVIWYMDGDEPPSPWLTYHSDYLVRSFEDAITALSQVREYEF